MKVLNYVGGTAAIRVVGDAVTPRRPPPYETLVSHIAARYSFAGRPPPVAQGLLHPLAFQQGRIELYDDLLAVDQLMMFPDGYAVVTRDTETAELVLNDFVQDLGRLFGYRFGEGPGERLYASALVVEFDARFVGCTRIFSIFKNAVRAARHVSASEDGPWLKKLTLGWQDSLPIGAPSLVGQVISTDFSIEPRAGVPLNKHAHFSTAPLLTPEHTRYLEQLEATVMASEA